MLLGYKYSFFYGIGHLINALSKGDELFIEQDQASHTTSIRCDISF